MVFRALVAAFLFVAPFVPPAHASVPPEFENASRFVLAGQFEPALRAYEAFIDANPNDRLSPVAAAAAANLQIDALHDSTAALAAFDRIIDDYPGCAYALAAAVRKGECAEGLGRPALAAAAYDRALQMAISGGVDEAWVARVLEAAARAYTGAGEPQKAVEACGRMADSRVPEIAAAACFRMGEIYESMGDGAKAAQSYRRVIEGFPSSTLFDPAMARRPLIEKHEAIDWPAYEKYAAGTRILRRDYPRALALTDSVLALASTPALRECAEYRKISLETAIAGDYTEGCRRLRAFIDAHPGGLRTAYARTVLEQNWQPVADLEAQVKAAPEDAGALSALGQMYAQVRSVSRAIEVLERALALEPDDDTVHLMLGTMYMQAGRTEDSVRAFDFYLQRNPDDGDVLNMIGYGHLNAGQAEQAIPYFERFAALSPNDPNAHDSLGEGLLGAGRVEEAAREYEKAVALDPEFSNSHFMLGRIYHQLGSTGRSAAEYRRFLELVSDGPQADEARAALAQIDGSTPKETKP